MLRLAVCSIVIVLALPAGAATPITWRHDRFANEFWVLDKLSAWDGDERNAYVRAFEQRGSLDPARRELLRRYADVRRKHAARPHTAPPAGVPFDMMPPAAGPAERFAIAFLTARDEVAAVTALGLDADERATVLEAFRRLRPDLDTLVGDAGYLDTARTKLEADASAARMDEFLDQMKTFYAVDDAAPYTVHLLWAPPGFGQATVWDHDIVLPLTAKTVADERALAGWLGVVVHELGHAFLAEKPEAARAELSRRIVDAGGVLTRRHANIIDEATQTALGNVLFMRTRLPAGFDTRSLYAFDPDVEYPDAIDSLARAVAPLVEAALTTRDGFATVYLAKALDAQRGLFGDRPLHHAHVALVLAASAAILHDFEGLFFGRSRVSYALGDTAQLADDSRASPTTTRWLVLVESAAPRALWTQLGTASLALGKAAACARATRRAVGAGYDVVVVGKDEDAVRRMLIALHRAREMPTKPMCL
jgi:hypothetical protein